MKKIGKIFSAIPGDNSSRVMDVIELEGEWYVGVNAFGYPESRCELITFDIYNVPDDWRWLEGWDPGVPPPPPRTRPARSATGGEGLGAHLQGKYRIVTGPEALEKVRDIVSRHDLGRLGLHDAPYPYVVPMNHSLVGDALYLHGAFEGKKLDLMRRNPLVCYEIDAPLHPGPQGLRSCHLEYESVLFFGRIREVTGREERYRILQSIMEQYGMPFKHGSEERCNAYVIALRHASARTGRFRPHSERDLYLYDWPDGTATRAPSPAAGNTGLV